MTTFLVPLDAPFGPGGPHWGGPPPFLPFLGVAMCLLFLAVIAAAIFLVRSGKIGPPPWAGSRSPEAEAKKTLADRFARGDISADEFMERASVLNWTPGSEAWETKEKKRR